jgi:hypothetical protein
MATDWNEDGMHSYARSGRRRTGMERTGRPHRETLRRPRDDKPQHPPSSNTELTAAKRKTNLSRTHVQTTMDASTPPSSVAMTVVRQPVPSPSIDLWTLGYICWMVRYFEKYDVPVSNVQSNNV